MTLFQGRPYPEVYVKSEEDYKEIFNIGNDIKDESIHLLEKQIDTTGDGTPVVVFNSLSWVRSETITIKGGSELIGVGAYDENGNLLDSDLYVHPFEDDQVEMSVYIPNIPEMGYRTIWLKPNNVKKHNGSFHF